MRTQAVVGSPALARIDQAARIVEVGRTVQVRRTVQVEHTAAQAGGIAGWVGKRTVERVPKRYASFAAVGLELKLNKKCG